MYVLYSGDEKFIQDMVTKIVLEVAEEEACNELAMVLNNKDNHLMYRCLFFIMVDFHAKFRYWVLGENNLGLQPISSHKVSRFLRVLREELVPKFLVNETMRLDDFDRSLKVEYIRS